MNLKPTHPVQRAGQNTALLLTGGGARSAYQVGVLRSLVRAYPELHFPILSGVSGGADVLPPMRGMVDTAPLRKFLHRVLETEDGLLHGAEENIRTGRLAAVGISTTKYPTAESVTWVQGTNVQPWASPDRSGIPT